MERKISIKRRRNLKTFSNLNKTLAANFFSLFSSAFLRSFRFLAHFWRWRNFFLSPFRRVTRFVRRELAQEERFHDINHPTWRQRRVLFFFGAHKPFDVSVSISSHDHGEQYCFSLSNDDERRGEGNKRKARSENQPPLTVHPVLFCLRALLSWVTRIWNSVLASSFHADEVSSPPWLCRGLMDYPNETTFWALIARWFRAW